MAGINLIKKNDSLEQRFNFEDIQARLNFLPNYKSKVLFENETICIGSNAYDEYPIKKYVFNNINIILEGEIYNLSEAQLQQEFILLISSIGKPDFLSKVESFIRKSDGDFIVYIISGQSLFIINDIFGRLPLYYTVYNNTVIVSRHLKFFTELYSFEFNKMAIAQFLLLGYMFDKNSLLKDVFHLRPASILTIDGSNIVHNIIPSFNFDIKENSNFKESVKTVSNLFLQSTKDRFQKRSKNIMTLSGGLDSRLVASALYYAKIPFETVTMVYNNGYASEEISIAEQLSKIYNVKCEKISLDPPSWEDMQQLLEIKSGMNSLATSPIIPFYKILTDKYGNDLNYITGDNGDKIMFTLDVPPRNFINLDDLTDYFIDQHSVWSIDEVSKITGIQAYQIRNSIKSVFEGFPEKDLFQKYVHWRAIEKPFNYAFIGEDRHRSYFWNISTFWSQDYFRYLMKCNDKLKRKHRMFRAHLDTYSVEASKLVYSNFKASVHSSRGRIFMFVVYNIYPRLPKKLKNIIKRNFFQGNPIVSKKFFLYDVIEKIFKDNNEIGKYLNLTEFRETSFSKVIMYNILTISAAIAEFSGQNKVLLRFPEIHVKDEY